MVARDLHGSDGRQLNYYSAVWDRSAAAETSAAKQANRSRVALNEPGLSACYMQSSKVSVFFIQRTDEAADSTVNRYCCSHCCCLRAAAVAT